MSKNKKKEKDFLFNQFNMTKHYLTNTYSDCTFNTITLQKEKFVAVRRINIMEVKFFYCKHCGKIIVVVKDSVAPTVCCGEDMSELVPGTTDAAVEKHVPVVNVEGNKVTVSVGSVAHPMLPEHFIEWVVLVTDKGIQKKQLKPGDEPKAEFALLDGEKVVSAYEYCNLHRLWKC